jgi:hypothetical protein
MAGRSRREEGPKSALGRRWPGRRRKTAVHALQTSIGAGWSAAAPVLPVPACRSDNSGSDIRCLGCVPFVVDLPCPERKRSRRHCSWHVSPTGNYSADLQTGAALAQQYLEFRDCVPRPLQWIVGDMPRELTGIEIGFSRLIGLAASPHRHVRFATTNSRVEAQFAARNGESEAQ